MWRPDASLRPHPMTLAPLALTGSTVPCGLSHLGADAAPHLAGKGSFGTVCLFRWKKGATQLVGLPPLALVHRDLVCACLASPR